MSELHRIGVIAGNGKFPRLIVQAALRKGHEVVVLAHEGLTDPDIERDATRTLWLKIGQLEAMIRGLKESGTQEVVLAGGFQKTLLYSNFRPDLRAIALLARVRSKEDDVILRALAEELEMEGIQVREATLFLQEILATVGVMSGRGLETDALQDIRFGWDLAKEVGRLDIGQCIVVKDLAVIAVEAVEGTDETIRRGGRLGGPGVRVIKVCKPGQDTRFDLPTVGTQTLESMIEVGASVLAVEAGKTVMIEREAMIAMAETHQIMIVGLDAAILREEL